MLILKSKQFNDDELITFARSLSSTKGQERIEEELLHWSFGPIMTMKTQENAQNYLFSKESVPLHWDGAFYKEPKKLLFYCTQSSGKGGETLFVDTKKVWNSLSESEKEYYKKIKLTYKTEKLAHYGGEFSCDLVQTHPEDQEYILRLAEKVETSLNPVTLEVRGDSNENFLPMYERLVTKFYSSDFLYAHTWNKGDVIVCDNFTYLHGRLALGENVNRTFKRIQIL